MSLIKKTFLFLFLISTGINSFSQEISKHSSQEGIPGKTETMNFEGIRKSYKRGNNVTENRDIGLFTYRYANSIIKLQYYQNDTTTYWLTMNSSNGESYLKNGSGYLIELDSSKGHADFIDSLVYQISDSFKSGDFKRFRKYKSEDYSKIETGQYNKNKMEGMWKCEIAKFNYKCLITYTNDKFHGKYELHSPIDQRFETGNFSLGVREGTWVYYDSLGRKVKVINYRQGREFGEYIEFYGNGLEKVKGNYIQIPGKIDQGYIAVGTGNSHTEKIRIQNKPVRNGDWFYYGEIGNVVKKVRYNKGRRK